MKRSRSSILGGILLALLLTPAGVTADAATRNTARDATAALSARHHTYYVATNGNDGHVGSSAHPFRTIQRGLRRARAGDTVVVRSGRYQPASFVRGGATGAPITLKGKIHTRLRGNGSGVGLTVAGVRYVVVVGFRISNFEVGIGVDDASHVVVRRNTLRGNDSTGIQSTHVRNVRVVRNRLIDVGLGPSTADQDYGVNFYDSRHVAAHANYFFGLHNQALSFKRRISRGSANGNTFEGCLYTCIFVGQNDDDPNLDKTSSWITVERNRFRAVSRGGRHFHLSVSITVRNVRNALIEHNVFDPSCFVGVRREGSPHLAGRDPGHNRVRHNVVKRWGH